MDASTLETENNIREIHAKTKKTNRATTITAASSPVPILLRNSGISARRISNPAIIAAFIFKMSTERS